MWLETQSKGIVGLNNVFAIDISDGSDVSGDFRVVAVSPGTADPDGISGDVIVRILFKGTPFACEAYQAWLLNELSVISPRRVIRYTFESPASQTEIENEVNDDL